MVDLLVNHLNKVQQTHRKLSAGCYENVTVLPIMWGHPKTTSLWLTDKQRSKNTIELADICGELEELSRIFSSLYNYKVKDILHISADDGSIAYQQLSTAILTLVRKHSQGPHNLIIIIYGGHGRDTRDTDHESVWVS